MSHKQIWYRAVASTMSVIGIAALVSAGGCSDAAALVEGCDKDFTAAEGWGSKLDIDSRVKSFMGASGALVTISDAMVGDVSAACEGIAESASRDKSVWSSLEGADRLQAACAEANLGIEAVFQANASVTLGVLVEGGGCTANLQASADCNAKCDVSGKCTPAQLEAKCEAGQIAGKCSAECSGTCTADVGATVACTGACSATCKGTCAASTGKTGKCSRYDANNNCDGLCDGVCTGSCSGSCTLETNTTVNCAGSCKGDCSVTLEAPHCEGKLTPPECSLDADCEASCRAQVQAEASCTPPKVTIQVVGTAAADLEKLVPALQTHLPTLITNLGTRGAAAIDAANVLVSVGDHLGDAITSSGKAFVCTTLAATAAFDASVEIKVSVEASASVGGSAAGTAK